MDKTGVTGPLVLKKVPEYIASRRQEKVGEGNKQLDKMEQMGLSKEQLEQARGMAQQRVEMMLPRVELRVRLRRLLRPRGPDRPSHR